jgi:hypothetical protein
VTSEAWSQLPVVFANDGQSWVGARVFLYTLIYTTTNHRLGHGQAITLNTKKFTGKKPRGISFLL